MGRESGVIFEKSQKQYVRNYGQNHEEFPPKMVFPGPDQIPEAIIYPGREQQQKTKPPVPCCVEQVTGGYKKYFTVGLSPEDIPEPGEDREKKTRKGKGGKNHPPQDCASSMSSSIGLPAGTIGRTISSISIVLSMTAGLPEASASSNAAMNSFSSNTR